MLIMLIVLRRYVAQAIIRRYLTCVYVSRYLRDVDIVAASIHLLGLKTSRSLKITSIILPVHGVN